jgi:serine/threonine-protein kinase
MELVRGGSMEEHRRRFGDARWASPILRQIAHGLAALHAQNVVHRDLKPANVLLVEGSGGPAAKISDFGISRFGALDDSADVDVEGDTMEHGASTDTTPLTQTGVIIGTPLYMPPEAGFGSARNPSADLFSFGVLAYEALTGQLPFPVPPVLLARGRQAIPPPRPLGGVDDEVTRLVMACLSLDPLERPRARDLASGL